MFRDKTAGMFYGVAYGDALGATIEKLSHAEIKKRYGRVETHRMPWHKADWSAELRRGRIRGHGIFTDDTLMTMALMAVYAEKQRHLDAYDLAEAFVNQIYYVPYYVPELERTTTIMERLFYPEQFIFLRHALANCEPREGGIGNMVNCGAAMYIAPVGAVNAGDPQAAYAEAIAFAQGHQASYGLEAAGVLAACVAEAFRPGATIPSILDVAQRLAKDGTKLAIDKLLLLADALKAQRQDKDAVVQALHAAILPFSPMGDDVNRSPDKLGKPTNHYTPSRLFSIEELPIALFYIALHEGDFEESIVDGINSGRDTDSIGVMIGAILGAFYGSSILQKEVVAELSEVNHYNLKQIADDFGKTAERILRKDMESKTAWIDAAAQLLASVE